MTSSNIDAASKFYEVYNTKNLELINSIFTDDYIGHVNAHDIVGAENAKGREGRSVYGSCQLTSGTGGSDWLGGL